MSTYSQYEFTTSVRCRLEQSGMSVAKNSKSDHTKLQPGDEYTLRTLHCDSTKLTDNHRVPRWEGVALIG